MDPTVVLKYVREQRRQINDKFNTHQKLSPNSLSVSPNSASPNPVFQAPQAPIVRSRYPNSYPIDQNYSQKQMNMMDMNNNNNNYAHKMMFNAMQKQELDMCIMNRSIQNSSQKNDNYYHQMQMANEALSRSASVKSDSGIGSNSPSSDNSDYNSNPNYMYQKNYKPIQPHLPQMPHQQIMSPSSPFQMVKKRKNSYDDTCLYPNKIDNMQERAFQNYAKNIPENSNMNIFNPNNNNNINNNNINTTNNNNNNNNNSNNNSNKVPLHNSYYANQQICDKECCAHLKQINVQKPITPKHIQNNVKSQYCDCKECNDLLKKKNYPVQMHPHMQPHMPSHMTTQINLPPGYCDCPSCNIALANNSKTEAKNNHHNLVTPKPVMINPLPPVPTNRFVISQNSSFSPIAPTLQKYPQNIDPNYKFKKDNFNPYETSQEHGLNKCSCPECLKYKPGEISPKALSQKSSNQNSGLVKIAKQSQLPQQPLQPQQISQTPQQPQNPYSQKPKIAQQTGLTLPVVLAADLANYENYQSIVKQKNTYYSEINKRKIDEEAQSKQPVITPQTTYYKKNRVLNHDSNNNTNNTNIPNKSEKKNNEGLRCLNNDDIELGEVVNVNKVENEQIPKSASQETLIESFNRDSESPVAISKKMMPIISKRTNDWLEKSVEFTFKLSQISGLSLDKLFNILLKSWSKLLFIYMIEHNLEFYVTKDYSIETKIVSYPKERDASNLLEIINRGHQDLGLESQGYDLLREIVLLNEGVNDVQFSARLNVANSRLKESLSGQDSRYEKLVAFLPNIHNIKSSLIENLFYKNSPVQDILNKKLSDLLNKRVENVDTE